MGSACSSVTLMSKFCLLNILSFCEGCQKSVVKPVFPPLCHIFSSKARYMYSRQLCFQGELLLCLLITLHLCSSKCKNHTQATLLSLASEMSPHQTSCDSNMEPTLVPEIQNYCIHTLSDLGGTLKTTSSSLLTAQE